MPAPNTGTDTMKVHEIMRHPDEHARFAAYLTALEHVTGPDEPEAVGHVLSDPDRPMAESAVLRHLDRRADGLLPGDAYDDWTEAMTRAVADRPFLTRRLREWSLFRAIALGQSWRPDDLLTSSNWLQLRTAGGTNAEALGILTEGGRTRRIRNTARATLNRLGGQRNRPAGPPSPSPSAAPARVTDPTAPPHP